eukprot:gene14910-biopygen2123
MRVAFSDMAPAGDAPVFTFPGSGAWASLCCLSPAFLHIVGGSLWAAAQDLENTHRTSRPENQESRGTFPRTSLRHTPRGKTDGRRGGRKGGRNAGLGTL